MAPEYVNEVEVVLGRRLFDDQVREMMFIENPDGLDIASREIVRGVYGATVRVMAEARAAERRRRFPLRLDPKTGERLPLTNGDRVLRQVFNEEWLEGVNENERKLKRIAAGARDRVGALVSTLSNMRFGELTVERQLRLASQPTPRKEKCVARSGNMFVMH